jgi:hypothetical protein
MTSFYFLYSIPAAEAHRPSGKEGLDRSIVNLQMIGNLFQHVSLFCGCFAGIVRA